MCGYRRVHPYIRAVKAKFHYARWFELSWSPTSFEPVCDQIRSSNQTALWNLALNTSRTYGPYLGVVRIGLESAKLWYQSPKTMKFPLNGNPCCISTRYGAVLLGTKMSITIANRGREFAFECVLLLRRSLRPHQDAEKMRLCCVAYCMMRQFSPQFAIVFFARSRVPCDAAIRPSIRGM